MEKEIIKKYGLKITVHPKKRIEYKKGDILGNNITFIKEINPLTIKKSEDSKLLVNIRRAKFRCFCGKEFKNKISMIKSKMVLSCGCLVKVNLKKYYKEKKNATKR